MRPRRSSMAILDPIFRITSLPYMSWIHWNLVLVKRTSLMALSVPFCDDVIGAFQKTSPRNLSAALFVHGGKILLLILYKVLLSLLDESIYNWLFLVRWSPWCTNIVDGTGSDALLFVAISLSLFMAPNDDENRLSLLMTWFDGQTGHLVCWSNRSIIVNLWRHWTNKDGRDTTRWVESAPCIVNEIVSYRFDLERFCGHPCVLLLLTVQGTMALKFVLIFDDFSRGIVTKDTSTRFTSRRSVIVYSSS